jgi:CheY-like chemotaxis protein
LIVDDNADSLESMALMLGAGGHDVRTAADGPSAIETARGFSPELVLLDIGMPQMDGYETARRLRELPGGAAFRLVALTGYEDLQQEGAGFDLHLRKPVDPEKLRALVDTLS